MPQLARWARSASALSVAGGTVDRVGAPAKAKLPTTGDWPLTPILGSATQSVAVAFWRKCDIDTRGRLLIPLLR
jgi:hypothetical protein